ncbi:type II toxin-antitoxin system prevent-host-death family antitoxin [Enterococcus sp. 669A]|uniref:Antitoxin n=1 Tax=Candidatus Enterococcus moelleringii TaxID=2815325 RepID=A0ABS3L4X0_9ENTE|nr:type II toxin-antitoxin system prevent-host-death family antitoxin [Enterococcus sp. 669A]MBO1304658.1 type II toxin-antitoxin system prevent-host-death family antitoxin [Enterococcus sp. 669A]
MNRTSVKSSTAKRNLDQLLEAVNQTHTVIEIIDEQGENDAVLVGLSEWRRIQETLLLEQTGTLAQVRSREKDDSGFTDIDSIDWDAL